MITITEFRRQAMRFPEASEAPHFHKLSFRVRKKIFATYDPQRRQASLKLTRQDQDLFSSAYPSVIPVPNKWGQEGWTRVELDSIDPADFTSLLRCAYRAVAPRKLSDPLDSDEP